MKILFLILIAYFEISLTFHQTDYTCNIERYNLLQYDKSYVGRFEMKQVFVSRFIKQFIASVCLLKDVDLKYITSRTEARKFQSNEYRLFPFNYSENACQAVRHPHFGDYFSKFNCSFDIRSCYHQKGCYSCTNLTYDDSSFPPFAPRGKFKLTSFVTYKGNISLGVGEFYIEIKPTNPLEKTFGL